MTAALDACLRSRRRRSPKCAAGIAALIVPRPYHYAAGAPRNRLGRPDASAPGHPVPITNLSFVVALTLFTLLRMEQITRRKLGAIFLSALAIVI